MYTTEVNCQIVIALLKAHGIRRVIASPGTTNVAFIGSIQNDPDFEVFSAIDERHAAYMAVGMAAETCEPVVLSCTGATASRNYIPALTEAYYRKLPVLAITSTQVLTRRGQLIDQNLDRSQIQKDIATASVVCPIVTADYLRDFCERVVNEAILALKRHGGGPAHINLETLYPRDFSVKELPPVRKIERFTSAAISLPEIPRGAKVAVYIGSHIRFDERTKTAIEKFVASHQAVVFVSPVSSYSGLGAISGQLLCTQAIDQNPAYDKLKPDLVINIGEISADYAKGYFTQVPVWRVSEDGEIRDLFGGLRIVFEMDDYTFFSRYAKGKCENSYLADWLEADAAVRARVPELPFCNNWIGCTLYRYLPEGVSFHAGILSSVRSMGYLPPFEGKESFCNVGGFGIDGNTSTLIGASLTNPAKLFVGMVGDLSFFYDMNSLGNRHIGKNLRLVIVNNGHGAEFTLYNNPGAQFGAETKRYLSAGGHFGNQSRTLVKHYAEDLGYTYLSAETKEDFERLMPQFLQEKSDRSIILECFVDPENEIIAWKKMTHIIPPPTSPLTLRSVAGKVLPAGLKAAIKKAL